MHLSCPAKLPCYGIAKILASSSAVSRHKNRLLSSFPRDDSAALRRGSDQAARPISEVRSANWRESVRDGNSLGARRRWGLDAKHGSPARSRQAQGHVTGLIPLQEARNNLSQVRHKLMREYGNCSSQSLKHIRETT